MTRPGDLLTALVNGGWVVTWAAGSLRTAPSYGIYQQAYNADGTARGGEVRVNTLSPVTNRRHR